MIDIPRSHPRYSSLLMRERLIEFFEKGIVARAGLIAHGRGECFDYLLGERTIEPALKSIEAASALLLVSKNPVLSVNGNVCALVGEEIVKLSEVSGARIEINLFYRTKERERKIYEELKKYGAKEVLGLEEERVEIPNLESERRKVSPHGIFSADTVFVPLEDGDRTEHLVKMGKKVITVDLNPLSRTSMKAHITIVDNIVRTVPLLMEKIKEMKNMEPESLMEIYKNYNNRENLKEVLNYITERLKNL